MSSAAEPAATGSTPSEPRATVTAVVVAHDGADWLPTLLAALAASTRQPDVVVGVDTGSRDGSADLLRTVLGSDPGPAGQVLEVGRTTGFGAAVTIGLAASTSASAGPSEWVWLLHDDCAPAPDALARLLAAASEDPAIAIVGCRVRGWPRGRRLLEIGVSITGTGRRETGLEPGEQDQGQYDEVRDVLGASSAGLLVRRSAWDAVGGLDPRLPLFRDDVDLGWRAAAAGYRVVVAADAVVFHAEAASRGIRDISCTSRRAHRADRAAGLHTVLANCRGTALPFVYLRLLVGSLLRALGYLLGKLPAAAWDEVVAAGAVLGRPGRLVGARRWRREHRPGRPVSARHLLPPWWTPYATGLDALSGRFAQTLSTTATSLASSGRRLRGGWSAARHPLAVLLVVLAVASLVASRGLWGSGFLQGGALLPAPDRAAGWWRLFAEVEHPVGLGSDLPAAPYTAVLAIAGTVLLGKAWLVVDLVMLLAPVLAGFGAWVASARLVRGVGVRVWMTVAYALVPVVTGAVATGHLGTVAVVELLPWVFRSAGRLLDPTAEGRWGAAWATGLTLSLATAFAPVCWVVVAALGGTVVVWQLVARPAQRHEAAWAVPARCLLALVLPLVLLAPWSWRLLTHPALVRLEAGVVDVPGSAPLVHSWQLAFFRLGAPGQASWWVTGGVTLAALAALLRPDTRARVGAAWLVAAAGLAAAAVLGRDVVTLPAGAGQAYPWLGVPVVFAAAGLVAAAGIGADGLRGLVGARSFGWRQPLAVIAVVAALSAPLLGLLWLVGPASYGDLHRTAAVPVPAYLVDAMSSTGARALVLRTGGSPVDYRVLAGDGLRLGDDSVLPDRSSPSLAAAVGELLSPSGPADLRALTRLGIGYVVLPSPQDPAAVARLDALAGLSRTSTEQAVLSGWQVKGAGADAGSASGSLDTSPADRGVRGTVLAGLGLAWAVVVVLAAPGIRRRPEPAEDAS